jgi:hypothetical protein
MKNRNTAIPNPVHQKVAVLGIDQKPLNDLQQKDFRKPNNEVLTDFVDQIQSLYDKVY